ncbi:MAG: DUF4450 domain-containing protein, partial [Candidatus Hydrogenedentales bacterium]
MSPFRIATITASCFVLLVVATGGGRAFGEETATPNCYLPVPGGWSVRITGHDANSTVPSETSMGQAKGDPRMHRRPLFPPADKSLVWTKDEREKLERCSFRPLALAYNAPRFLLDFHSAGGLLGHLFLGITEDATGKSAWLHEWSDLEVAYIDGAMHYTLSDPRFPSIKVRLTAAALADAVGLIVRYEVEGDTTGHSLGWVYGGASAFLTNYDMMAAEFSFAPSQCSKDNIQWNDGVFALRRPFDDNDVYKKEVYAAARYLDGWEATVKGGSTSPTPCGFGQPEFVLKSPGEFCSTAEWAANQQGAERKGKVAAQRIALSKASRTGHIVIGMGHAIDAAIRNPGASWKKAIDRNRSIANRVVIDTPDPYLNAAVPMMAFATEGTWGDLAILHGGWSWRYAYLGWRGWYGSNCYGWTDRVRRSIESHTSLGLVREGDDQGALSSLLEYPPGVFYNMNEVFFDQTRHYFEYTNDLELMRKIFPVLKGIVAWEDRRLQPGGQGLYENSLNTWISDSHWYIGGQCTQASAYMLRAYTFLARLAPLLGEDGKPFEQQAERIRTALQEHLWMPDKGVFAEYRDTRGNRLLHPEPELPTIYHAAEFGAASPEQIARMLQWADRSLRHEPTPGGGQLTWSSNWFPNRGRTYTHSTYEMAYAEEFNFALTNFLAGRADDGYAILRASLCGIFNGPTPGGLACHSFVDGTQRANDEFTDAISMWGRCVTEGLFGIAPDRPSGVVNLSPQFPKGWEHASIKTPAFSYRWQRAGNAVKIQWSSPVKTRIALRLPIAGDRITRALVNGKRVDSAVELGFLGTNWARIETGQGHRGTIAIEYAGDPPAVIAPVESPNPMPAPATVWAAPKQASRDLTSWSLIDLSQTFNANVIDVPQKIVESATPPAPPASQVGFSYWRDHLTQYHGSRNEPISDAAWRAKTGTDGVAWTADGIPFKSAKEGPNIGVVTRVGGFPEALTFPVGSKGNTLFLMLSGMTFPAQSHVANLRVTLTYADGQAVARDLVNPTD